MDVGHLGDADDGASDVGAFGYLGCARALRCLDEWGGPAASRIVAACMDREGASVGAVGGAVLDVLVAGCDGPGPRLFDGQRPHLAHQSYSGITGVVSDGSRQAVVGRIGGSPQVGGFGPLRAASGDRRRSPYSWSVQPGHHARTSEAA